jgi:hypothetical protein
MALGSKAQKVPFNLAGLMRSPENALSLLLNFPQFLEPKLLGRKESLGLGHFKKEQVGELL